MIIRVLNIDITLCPTQTHRRLIILYNFYQGTISKMYKKTPVSYKSIYLIESKFTENPLFFLVKMTVYVTGNVTDV